MSRLIDADALIKNYIVDGAKDDSEVISRADIDNAPTVDAEPIRHGKWMPHPRYDEFDVCSKCGIGCRKRMHGISNGMPYTEEVYYGFCPNCGAKMDGERKENDS